MLPLLALSTLDSEEVKGLEQHLAGCVECRAELDDWQATTAALAHTAEPLEPSAQVRDRILAAVRAESSSSRADNVIPISSAARATSSPSWSWKFQSIAAAVIFLGLIIGLIALWRQNHAYRTEVARLSEQMKGMSRQLDQEHQVLALLTKPGMRMAELAGTKEAPAAHGMLAVDRKSGHAVFMAQGLPQAPAGKAYQLWFIAGSKPMPGRVFKADAAGNAMMDEQLPPEALNAGTFAVTLEPQGGGRVPSGPMYLLTPAGAS